VCDYLNRNSCGLVAGGYIVEIAEPLKILRKKEKAATPHI